MSVCLNSNILLFSEIAFVRQCNKLSASIYHCISVGLYIFLVILLSVCYSVSQSDLNCAVLRDLSVNVTLFDSIYLCLSDYLSA